MNNGHNDGSNDNDGITPKGAVQNILWGAINGDDSSGKDNYEEEVDDDDDDDYEEEDDYYQDGIGDDDNEDTVVTTTTASSRSFPLPFPFWSLLPSSPRVRQQRQRQRMGRNRLRHPSQEQQQQQQQQKQSRRVTTSSNGRGSGTPVFLTHERDFFRQLARLNSMDSYVLVSTLTASMSFGCLVSYVPSVVTATTTVRRILSGTIQAVAGLSTLCGLYATVIFSLTILYGKSALGAERDREYDRFLRGTVRARVRGSKCFSLSLALFALEAVLVMVERTSTLCGGNGKACFRYAIPAGSVACFLLFRLYQDWHLLARGREEIFRD